ncbi:MAG: CinA family protein [Gammaproteobacteria bacterium]
MEREHEQGASHVSGGGDGRSPPAQPVRRLIIDSAPPELGPVIDRIAAALLTADLRLVTAESCTGGLIAATLTAVPDSSHWFEGAFVTYRLSAKTRMVGVAPALLDRQGAVSEPVVRAMAEGALSATDAGVSLAVSGVAGPTGGSPTSPVGTVWFAWALRDPTPRCAQTAVFALEGDRDSVRAAAVEVALRGLDQLLNGADAPLAT